MANVSIANGPLVAQDVGGSLSVPWILLGPCPFLLTRADTSQLLDQVTVYGVAMNGKLASSSSTNTCQLQPGQSTCTMTLYWSVPDGWNESIAVYNGSALFATSGINGSGTASWISSEGNTFYLYAGSKLLDTLYVHATQ